MNTRGQEGFALLLVLLVVMAFGAGVFLTMQQRGSTDPDEAARTGDDLRAGLAGLVAYAAWGGVSTGRPATVPCPDISDPGTEGYGRMNAGVCGGSASVHLRRLPWKTLDLEPAAEPLWLAVDDRFVNHGKNEPLNPDRDDVDGNLRLNGQPGFAAIVLAPGEPVENQPGRPSADIADYLEAHNSEIVNDFPTARFEDCGGIGGQTEFNGEIVSCNDRALGITAERLLALGARRALAEVEAILQGEYSDVSELPYAAVPGTEPLLPCRENELTGLLPLTAGDPDEGGCGGDEFLDICKIKIMPQWIRPYEGAEEFEEEKFPCLHAGDEGEAETGNDWLRFITYDFSDDCETTDGERAVCLGFVETFDEIEGFEDLDRKFTLTGGGSE